MAPTRNELRYLGFFALATLVLTWPMAVTFDQAYSIRGDYFINIWNAWWVRFSLFDLGASPYWTDYLHTPTGIDLGRHSLSPLNAAPVALLQTFLSPHAAMNVLILAHFTLSGWALFLLARELTGHVPGSLLAGLIYSFCPFHYYYMAQLNVATLEFLPLAVLFFLRTWRDGGARNMLATTLAVAALTASAPYYLVYFFLIAGLVVVAGRLWDPSVAFLGGLRRAALAGVFGGLAVGVLAWPLLAAALGAGDGASASAAAEAGVQLGRANDLYGYKWVGPPDVVIVSWPTMLGYSTLLLLVLGWRTVLRQRFWLLVGGVFLLMSLGGSLSIGGEDRGLPLPYSILGQLPVLSMLRKPDRCFAILQLVAAVLSAFAWRELATRFRSQRAADLALAGVAVLVMVEMTGVPFTRYDYDVSPYFAELAEDSSVESLVHLPSAPGSFYDGRYNFAQVFHEKKIPQGYTTSLAVTKDLAALGDELSDAFESVKFGQAQHLARIVKDRGLDLVVLHKTFPQTRPPISLDRSTTWAPFFFVRRELVWSRQTGGLIDQAMNPSLLRLNTDSLARILGAPVFEDEKIVVYRAPAP